MAWTVGVAWAPASAACPPPICEDQLVIVGSVHSPTQLTGAAHFDYAAGLCYVAANDADRLTVVDVSGPADPIIVGSFTHAQLGNILGIYYDAADEVCYCCGQDGSNNRYLSAVDVSNPASMSIIGTLVDAVGGSDFLSGARDPIRDGDLLYVPWAQGITIVDVSDPTDPTLIGFTSVAEAVAEGGYTAIKVADLVYINFSGTSDILVFDVSTPATPTYESGQSFLTTGFNSSRGMLLDGGLFYVASDSALTIIDMSVPEIVGQVTDAVLAAGSGVAKDGDIVYVGAFESLVLVDVSTPATPTISDFVTEITRLRGSGQVVLNGTTIYVASASADRFNVLQPDCLPVLVDHVGTLTHANAPYNALVADGDYAYGVRGTQDRLGVIDISDPTTPTLVGNVTDSDIDLPIDIAKQGAFVYVVAFNNDSLTVFDVSTPASPVNVGTLVDGTNLDAARFVTVAGVYAYVAADGTNRFTVVDVSNPASMSVEGSITDATLLASGPVVKVGDHVFMANLTQAVTSIDVSDPTDPTIVDSITSSDVANARGVAVAGSVLFVSTTTSLVSIDISDPTNLSVIATIPIPSGGEVVYSGGYAVVSSTAGAVYVVDVSDPASMFVIYWIEDPGTFGTSNALALSGCKLVLGGFIVADTFIFAFDVFFGSARSAGWAVG